MASTVFTKWFQGLPLVWLYGRKYGQAQGLAQGTLFDGQVDSLTAATEARLILDAPSDALPYIGNDSLLLRGVDETEDQYRIRLQTRWDDWARAGTPLELLVQLYWAGYADAIIAQQNGLLYSLSGAPTEGQDPTSLLVINHAGTLIAPLTSATNPVNIPTTGVTSYSPDTPVETPWFTFNDRTSVASQFCIILPTVPTEWTVHAVATFTASSTATATWSTGFTDTNYEVASATVVTDGSGPIITTTLNKTKMTIDVQASNAFTGTVFLLGWPPGTNPFSTPHPSDINTLKSIIKTWKNASAYCTGVYTIIQGQLWGYPVLTWGRGGTWGPGSSQAIIIGA